MTTVGADQFADAPFIELGTSSAYTPNTGYSTEPGEPTAAGGKTAWWRFNPTVDAFVYVDVLYSTGVSAQSWSYRAFVPDPDFTDLFPVSAPSPGAQGGFNAAAGGTYWIRVDSDGTDISYVLSVGADVYEYVTETRTLIGPEPEAEVVEGHFTGTGQLVGGPGVVTGDMIVADNVEGGGLDTAVMHVESYADDVIAQYPTYGEANWYDVNDPEDHPILVYGLTVGDATPVDTPDGFDLFTGRVKVAIWSTAGPPLEADVSGNVGQIQLSGSSDPASAVRYLDDTGSPLGDVPVGVVGAVHTFRPSTSMSSSGLLFYYNDESLRLSFRPNLVGTPGAPYPVGTWFFGVVTLEFVFQSDTPLPYEPPAPPVSGVVAVLRLLPRKDGLGAGGLPRMFGGPHPGRMVGQQP